jgi:PAS domain S-box-containing protein
LHQAGLKRYQETSHRHINWQGTELIGLRKNGEEFPVEVSFGEITNNGNRVFTGFIRDISERKQAEEALRASERELSLIIETIPGLVWCATPDGELNYLNQQLLDYTGTSAGDWAQLGWKNLLHPDDAEPTAHAWSHAVATGQPYEVQCRLRRSDGAYRWFQALGQAARDSEGGLARWYGLLIDIDDRKNMEEALRSSQARLSRAIRKATVGEFAAAIAHEINQPLAAVVTNGQACLRWLAAQPPGVAKAQEAAERIVRDGKEAGEVVRRIRALFKQAAIEMIELDLNEVIGEVLHLLNGEVTRKRVAVETDLSEDLAPIAGDRVQLQQVVFNLLLNGIEAMDSVVDGPKTLFVCSKRPSPETVLVEVRDSGTGTEGSRENLRSFLYYERQRNGHGIGDLPFHHRCASRPAMGRVR